MTQPDIPPRGQEALPPAELTATQQQIWVAQKLHPHSPLYNMAFAFVFAAPLEEEIFRAAWQAVADGSDALRTRIVEDASGQPRCAVSPRGRHLETATVDGDFLDWCRERCARPLALDGDLVDSVLVRLDDGRTGWFLNQHHLIADAWSTVLLFRQVAAQYEAALSADVPRPPALHSYYRTIASLPRGDASRGPAREHWNSRLQTERRSIPLYGRPGAPAGTASTRLTLEIDERRSRALEDRCRDAGFSSLSESLSRFALFATLLVSWLHRIERRARARVRRAGCRSSYPRGAADARRLHRNVPVRGRRRSGRHLQDACRPLCRRGVAASPIRAAGDELAFRGNGQQRRAELRARVFRRLRRPAGRDRVGAPRPRRQRARGAPAGPRLRRLAPLPAAFRLQRRRSRRTAAAPQPGPLRAAARRLARRSRSTDRRGRHPHR